MKALLGDRNDAKSSVEAVFHVAGRGHFGSSNLPAHDTATRETTVRGTANIVGACLQFKVKVLGEEFSFTTAFACLYLSIKARLWTIGTYILI